MGLSQAIPKLQIFVLNLKAAERQASGQKHWVLSG
jgi:hypothetical protein